MMRILHVISSLNPKGGGVSQAVRTMIAGLTDLDVLNEVVCIDMPDASYLNNEKFTVYALGPGKTPWQYAPLLLKWLNQNMGNYDTIIVHGLWHYQSYAVYKAFRNLNAKKPKLYVMPHGMLDPYFQKAKGRKLKAIRNNLFWMFSDGKLINIANGLLFTAETEKELARQPFHPYQPKKELVVGLGIESPPEYHTGMSHAFEKAIGKNIRNYWLYISRIHEKKGADLLVNAYISLKASNPDIPALVIAGPGLNTPYGVMVKQLAQGNENIIFCDMLTGDQKWGAFYGSSVFILPSHQENFGIAVAEALACRKPVIISNQINIWTEVARAQAGLITDDTQTAVLDVLNKWHNLPESDKHRTGINAQALYQRLYSIEGASKRLLASITN